MKTASDIVTEIDELLRLIWTQLDDPEGLSKTILQLAVLNGGLGNWYADAQDEERRSKATYEHKLDHTKLELMANEKDERGKAVSATYAESKAALALWDTQLSLLSAQHKTTVLRLKRQDTDSAIDAARSRLSLIKADIRQGTNQ